MPESMSAGYIESTNQG